MAVLRSTCAHAIVRSLRPLLRAVVTISAFSIGLLTRLIRRAVAETLGRPREKSAQSSAS
jgi:hypothetical protein